MSDNLPSALGGEFILYQTEDGRTRLEVRFKNETVWLSLNRMAALFQRDKSVVSRHIKNIFDEGELTRTAVVAESATTAADGKTYQVGAESGSVPRHPRRDYVQCENRVCFSRTCEQ